MAKSPAPKTQSSTVVVKNIVNNSSPTQASLLSALRSLFNSGLPEDIKKELRGPQGEKGDTGPAGGSAFTPLAPPSFPSATQSATVPNYNNTQIVVGNSAGFAALGAQELHANSLQVTGNITQTGGNTSLQEITTIGLTVNGNTSISGDLSVAGITSFSGATTYNDNLTITKQDPTLIFNAGDTSDTKFWTGVTDDNGNDDDDLFQIWDGTTPGTNAFLTINTAGNVGIGTTNPQTAFHIFDTDALIIPVGTTAERPADIQGAIRYNTTTSTFEGYSGVVWSGLGGVIDGDQDTYILAESSPGADEDTLFFNTLGGERARITPTGNLGIGTTTVSARLHSLATTEQLRLGYDATNYTSLTI